MEKRKTERVATTAERLREAMEAAGKKPIDLVNITGIDRGAISRYLAGKYEPKQTAVTKLALALDVSEMWLFGYDVQKTRTLEQKKNDQLAQLIVRMKRDPAFYNIVEMLDQVPAGQLEHLGGLIAGLLK